MLLKLLKDKQKLIECLSQDPALIGGAIAPQGQGKLQTLMLAKSIDFFIKRFLGKLQTRMLAKSVDFLNVFQADLQPLHDQPLNQAKNV